MRWEFNTEFIPQSLSGKTTWGKLGVGGRKLYNTYCRHMIVTLSTGLIRRINIVKKEWTVEIQKREGIFSVAEFVFQYSLCREGADSSPIQANYRHCMWCFSVSPPECRRIRQFKTVDTSEPGFSCDPAQAHYKHFNFSVSCLQENS